MQVFRWFRPRVCVVYDLEALARSGGAGVTFCVLGIWLWHSAIGAPQIRCPDLASNVRNPVAINNELGNSVTLTSLIS